MARTRLRGIKLAGISIAVESPPALTWDWPAEGLGELSCASLEAEVYIGVSVADFPVPCWDPITYAFDRGTFDIGRVADEWWVAVHGAKRRFERLARFNSRFSEGEVWVSPAALDSITHPMEGPLLDILLTHRIIDQGGLVVSGTAIVEKGRACALLGALASGDSLNTYASEAGLEDVATTPGDRFAIRIAEGQARVHGLPGIGTTAGLDVQGPLRSIHIVGPSETVLIEKMDREVAMGELLQHVYAPVHAPEQTDRLMDLISELTGSISIMRLGQPEEQRVVPFVWGRARAALAFALPLA
jgi:hypothetical protein